MMSRIIIIRYFNFFTNLFYLSTFSRSSPWSGSSFVFTSIRKSILLHPNIPASENKSSIYFLWDRKCPFWTWPPQRLRSTSEIWDPWSEKYFRLSIPLVSPPVITISSTYATSRIIFTFYIRQNTEWSFCARQRPNSRITNAKRPNQARRDCSKPYSDFFNLQTFTPSPWATKHGGAPCKPHHQEYHWKMHS